MSKTIEDIYKQELISAINKCVEKYEKRLRKNPSKKHKHVTIDEAAEIILTASAVGGALGSVAPGLGNAIGAATGIMVGAIITGAIAAHDSNKNKKIDNAAKVVDFLGENKRQIINKIAESTIKEQTTNIFNSKNDDKTRKSITAHLARNIMSAIKHNKPNSKMGIIADAIKHPAANDSHISKTEIRPKI